MGMIYMATLQTLMMSHLEPTRDMYACFLELSRENMKKSSLLSNSVLEARR